MTIYYGYSKYIVRHRRFILFFGGGATKYLVARALFLNGEYDQSKNLYKEVIGSEPKHVDSYYGLSEVYRLSGNEDKARDILTQVLTISCRLKTWLLLANLVNVEKDYIQLINLWAVEHLHWNIPKYHYDVNDYLIVAALRAKKYEDALLIVKELLENESSDSFFLPAPIKKEFSIGNAKKALLCLKEILNKNRIEFFLVSGTLLGCVRDRKMLKHDKDIDIGIWSNTKLSLLLKIISSSGIFDVSPMRTPHSLRIKHVNGTSIDIFYHYRTETSYWHGGTKLRWNNTPFNLIPYNFMGESFLIPEDYDLYLTENYGSWMLEKKKFDSAFDTTNSEVINGYELKIHAYKKLILSIKSNDAEGIEYYKNKLNSF